MSGTISLIGLLGGTGAQIEMFDFVEKNVRLDGVLVGSREMFEEMSQTVAEHQLKPVIDRVFGFGEVPAALRYLETGAHFGKICVRL